MKIKRKIRFKIQDPDRLHTASQAWRSFSSSFLLNFETSAVFGVLAFGMMSGVVEVRFPSRRWGGWLIKHRPH